MNILLQKVTLLYCADITVSGTKPCAFLQMKGETLVPVPDSPLTSRGGGLHLVFVLEIQGKVHLTLGKNSFSCSREQGTKRRRCWLRAGGGHGGLFLPKSLEHPPHAEMCWHHRFRLLS